MQTRLTRYVYEVNDLVYSVRHKLYGSITHRYPYCPMSDDWISQQNKPISNDCLNKRWYSIVFANNRGAVCVSEKYVK